MYCYLRKSLACFLFAAASSSYNTTGISNPNRPTKYLQRAENAWKTLHYCFGLCLLLLFSSCFFFLLVTGTAYSLRMSQQKPMLRKEIHHPLSESEALGKTCENNMKTYFFGVVTLWSHFNKFIGLLLFCRCVLLLVQSVTGVADFVHRWQNHVTIAARLTYSHSSSRSQHYY